MKVSSKTKQQLIDEITSLQLRIAELEAMEKVVAQTQQEFRHRFSRYFPQTDALQEAIYVIFDRKYEYINDQFAKIFGVTQEEACSPEFDPMTLVAKESRNFIRERHRKGSRGEFTTDRYEFTGIAKDGSRIECETFTIFIPYRWGVAIHGMLRDISVHKRIGEELQRNRSDLQIVLNSIPTSIFYTDRMHRFTEVNDTFCKSVGLPREQVIGKTFRELFPHLPAEQLSYFFEAGNQVLSSGASKRGVVEVMPSVRGRRWVQNDRIAHLDDKGNVIGIIYLAIDISDLMETEEKLWYMSFHDVLTGLYNKTYFEEELKRLEKGRQFPISIIAARLNDLAAINETKGIAAGNKLLQQTSKVLKVFRGEDVVARISGNQFAALMPLSDSSTAENMLLRLKANIEVHNSRRKGHLLNLSVGVATGKKGCSLLDILKEAEDSFR